MNIVNYLYRPHSEDHQFSTITTAVIEVDQEDSTGRSVWPAVFSDLLLFCYTILCLAACLQCSRLLYYRHNPFSFRFLFLFLAFIWTFLRILFFLISSDKFATSTLSSALYYLPTACQFATFSLLLLFYSQLLHAYTWKQKKRTLVCIVSTVNIIFLIFCFAFSFHISAQERARLVASTPEERERIELFIQQRLNAYFLTSAAFFGVLGCIAFYYLLQLSQAHVRSSIPLYSSSTSVTSNYGSLLSGNTLSASPQPVQILPHTSRTELGLAFIIFSIILSRCIFDFVAAFPSSPDFFTRNVKETKRGVSLDFLTALLLFIWEIIPAMLILVYFRHISHSNNDTCMDWFMSRMFKSSRPSAQYSPIHDTHDAMLSRSSSFMNTAEEAFYYPDEVAEYRHFSPYFNFGESEFIPPPNAEYYTQLGLLGKSDCTEVRGEYAGMSGHQLDESEDYLQKDGLVPSK